jgi:Lon protease-like protein
MLIPLFPLGLVLFPHMPLPLHIFEERYKTMIRECLEEDRAFGVVYFSGDELHRVGCTAKILDVLKRYEDGRLDIFTQGERRFAIKALYDEKPYLQARIAPVEDPVETPSEELKTLVGEGLDLLKQISRLTPTQAETDLNASLDATRLSFIIAGNEGFTAPEKQRFLEMTSTHDRLRKGVRSLSKVVERIKTGEEIRRIIGGNGQVSKSLAGELKKPN